MAENGNEIDKLYLDIKVEDDNSSKKINSVAKAIDNLQKSLKGLDSVKSQLASLQNLFTGLSKSVSKTPKIPETPKTDTNIPMYIDVEPPKIGGNSGGLEKIKGVDKDANESIKESTKQIEELGNKAEEAADGVKQLNNQLKNSGKETKRTSGFWSKLTKSIGRIALYRAIRATLKSISSALKEGFSNLRQVDENLDLTLKKMSASSTAFKNSVASMLTPLVQGIEPILTKISDSFANFMNRINEAKAAISGQSEYTKILTSDTEEYKKALDKTNGSLLKFDTFTTLASKEGYTGAKKEVVDMSEQEGKSIYNTLKLIEGVLLGIAGAIATIVAFKLINKLSDLSKSLKAAKVDSKEFKNSLEGIDKATTALAVTGIATLATGILSLIANWKDMGNTARWLVPILAVLAGAIATIVALKSIAKGNWVKALSIGAIATGVGLSVGSQISTMKFADGGSFNTADLFYANENGKTELIASSNNGGAVMNMEQLQSAIYNGMIMAMADSGSKEIVLNVNKDTLGRVVAQSTGFINTTNRRNPGLNLI